MSSQPLVLGDRFGESKESDKNAGRGERRKKRKWILLLLYDPAPVMSFGKRKLGSESKRGRIYTVIRVLESRRSAFEEGAKKKAKERLWKWNAVPAEIKRISGEES